MIKRIIEINSVPVVQVMPRAEVCRWQEVALAVLDGPPHLHGARTWLAGAVLRRCEISKVSSWDMPWEEREPRGK